MRNLQEQVRKTFSYQKLFWTFKEWIYCSSDLKIFVNSLPSASTFKSFSWSLDQFFLTVVQTNFGSKIPYLVIFSISLKLAPDMLIFLMAPGDRVFITLQSMTPSLSASSYWIGKGSFKMSSIHFWTSISWIELRLHTTCICKK